MKVLVGSRVGWSATAIARSRGCFVLTYHRVGANRYGFKNVSADTFRSQMRWLKEYCRPIHPDELRQAAATGARHRPAVLVTFDDGYLDYLDIAYPILRGLRIPAVNFISTHFADTGAPFWWDQIDLALRTTRRTQVSLPWSPTQSVALDAPGRTAVAREARRYIRSRPDAERDETLDALLGALDLSRDAIACERQVMNWSEIRQVLEFTVIGGHTHTHPLMSRVDKPGLERETDMCRQRIRAELGFEPTLFAYPGGAFTPQAKEVLARHGFEVAFSSVQGVNDATTDWLEVRRMHAPADSEQLPFVLSGLWSDPKKHKAQHVS
jgi:peptidoglycan/xylan/chitin deacetylase (PgdA/CDA1 family)